MKSKNQKKIDGFFAQFDQRFVAAIPNIVAETATEYFKQRFTEENWDNVPWPSLNPKYAQKKTAGRGRILTRNGFLVNSIRPSTVSLKRVVITAGNSKVPYARIHNEGLRVSGVRSVRSYTNSNFMGKGRAVTIKAHNRQVNYQMPQRRFMGRSAFLNQAIKNRLAAAYKAI
ncbi:phage virion morphogenesis protein [Croceivirga sp. JEA036]|uniref:phage virion morphogenesis protein n=1 Tax=Croceivirga sp. JEA036 TaxID=2721162 RepID=UPI001439E541|nr:phage virion morphogenesis protein [Croceivirga sp. JEA036]NJB36379.1 hypothetical protein [Croceivirga sp. JEA036]